MTFPAALSVLIASVALAGAAAQTTSVSGQVDDQRGGLSRVNATGRCAATASAAERGEFRALTPLFRWLRLVEQHEPGTDDAAAAEIGRWSRDQLDIVIGLVRRLSAVLREGQELTA